MESKLNKKFIDYCLKNKVAIRFFSQEEHTQILRLFGLAQSLNSYGTCSIFFEKGTFPNYSCESYFDDEDMKIYGKEKYPQSYLQCDVSYYKTHKYQIIDYKDISFLVELSNINDELNS